MSSVILLQNRIYIEIVKYWKWVRDVRLLDQDRDVIRKKHYSIRTEQAYVNLIR